MKNYWIIAVILMAICASCNKRERLDAEEDYILIRAMESARNQSDKGIDIEALKNCATIYEKRGEMGKKCLCDAFIGYKLHANENYDKSLIHLKKAEANLQYCDSIASFIYTYIVGNTMSTDTAIALLYARKAIEKDLEYNHIKKLPYSYMNMSLLTKGDSARYYLGKSLEYFDDWGDKIAKAKFAWWHINELDPDTIIEYAKPCYDSIQYTGHARILAEAYLKKGMADSAWIYIKQVKKNNRLKADYSFYNSRRLSLLGKHEEANKSWEESYYQQREDYGFMFGQRLGAINAEYDLLNEELENKKEKLMMMRVYNVALLMVVGGLLVAIGLIFRYKRSIGALEEDVVKEKERFNTLFEEYKNGYDLNKDRIYEDAQMNLRALGEEYGELTKTDLAIVWLTFMGCDKNTLCKLLVISSRYYYNRKSMIQRTLNVTINDSEKSQKAIERMVKKYMCKKKQSCR